MAIADVRTNINAEDMHDALLETFQKWVNFSLGVGKLGGKMLRHPSGRMAAALRADTDPDGNIVAIYLDRNELGAEEYNYLLHGHKEFSLKYRMLRPGLPGVKRSKQGNLYRRVPVHDRPLAAKKSFAQSAGIKNVLTERETAQGGVIGINRNLARMWISNYRKASTGPAKIRTMSYRLGSARWVIPAMHAFNIAKLLRDMVDKNVKGRVIA